MVKDIMDPWFSKCGPLTGHPHHLELFQIQSPALMSHLLNWKLWRGPRSWCFNKPSGSFWCTRKSGTALVDGGLYWGLVSVGTWVAEALWSFSVSFFLCVSILLPLWERELTIEAMDSTWSLFSLWLSRCVYDLSQPHPQPRRSTTQHTADLHCLS